MLELTHFSPSGGPALVLIKLHLRVVTFVMPLMTDLRKGKKTIFLWLY